MQRAGEWVDRKQRHPVAVEAVAHRLDGAKAPVTVTNLCDDGCCIEGANDFRVGERLRIAIPRMGHFRVQIRWSSPDSAGAKFILDTDF